MPRVQPTLGARALPRMDHVQHHVRTKCNQWHTARLRQRGHTPLKGQMSELRGFHLHHVGHERVPQTTRVSHVIHVCSMEHSCTAWEASLLQKGRVRNMEKCVGNLGNACAMWKALWPKRETRASRASACSVPRDQRRAHTRGTELSG